MAEADRTNVSPASVPNAVFLVADEEQERPPYMTSMTADEQMRYMRGVRLAAGLLRTAEWLDQSATEGNMLWSISAQWRGGVPQVRLLSPAIKKIGDDAVMLSGFDAVITAFVGDCMHVGTPDVSFFETATFRDLIAAKEPHMDAIIERSMGLPGGLRHG